MLKKQKILITGGSGFVGKNLTSLLTSKGYEVSHLSRVSNVIENVSVFKWDPEKNFIDPSAFDGVDIIIHLAGANIGEKRWTIKRKRIIQTSRINTIKLLYNELVKNNISIKAFICASGVGYYGAISSDKIYIEEDSAGIDFLAQTSKRTEEEADRFKSSDTRVVKIRTAVVIGKKSEVLSKLLIPGRFGFLVITGSGKQYFPWIHITDLCNIYLRSIEESSMNGIFNAVAPEFTDHRSFINSLAKANKIRIFPLNFPEILFKSILGEMSEIILYGSRISSKRLISEGFSFRFAELEKAMIDIFEK
jgi:uncharacterized protein